MTKIKFIYKFDSFILKDKSTEYKYKSSERHWEELQTETNLTIAVLKSDRIFRRVLETWEDLLSLSLQWKTTS